MDSWPISPPPELEWTAAGARILLSVEPYKLSRGCWTTGYIPRSSFERSGRPEKLYYRNGPQFLPDDLEEDQAIIINLKNNGLIVLSGCAHTGIVNTIQHARDFTGIDKIHAILGGFHLARASEEEIEKTIEYVKNIKPTFVIPSHCTGFQAIEKFATAMPEEFIEGIVGTTYYF